MRTISLNMVVATVCMLVALLTLVPIRLQVALKCDLSQLVLFAKVKVFFVPVFKEEFSVEGQYLVCKGTVDTNLDLTTVNGTPGINLAKALVWESVDVVFAVNFCNLSPFIMPILEVVSAVTTAVACKCSHCRFRSQTVFSQHSILLCWIAVDVCLADILAVIVKEEWRLHRRFASTKGDYLWKINK